MQDFLRKLSDVLTLARMKRRWQKISVLLAVVVLIITVYLLTLPAITMEGDTVCGLDEHQHTEDCFYQTYVLTCSFDETTTSADGDAVTGESAEEETTSGHIHTDECYELTDVLSCDYIEHTHSESCLLSFEEATTVPETTEPETTLSSEEQLDQVVNLLGVQKSTINYSSELTDNLIGVRIVDQQGQSITDGSVVYIGETYGIYLEFAEKNSGSEWEQFAYNNEGYLTYQIPANFKCEEFTSWHKITTTDMNTGVVEEVGEYFVDANGLLRVKFYDVTDTDGSKVNFIDKYSNTDFSINFEATVGSSQSGSSTIVNFGNEINVELEVDGGADLYFEKIMGAYDINTHTIEYELLVTATHGVVKNLVIDDVIWDKHAVDRNSIVVTDFEGNDITSQIVISDSLTNGALYGYSLSGFPDIAAGEGYKIKYRTAIDSNIINNYQGEVIEVYNYATAGGVGANGTPVSKDSEAYKSVELEKLEKNGKHTVIQDDDGNDVEVIMWTVRIGDGLENLNGNVVIDTLGQGLAYFTDEKLKIRVYDANGDRIDPTLYYEWGTDVIVNGSSMSFDLPEGYEYEVIYYTTFTPLAEGETRKEFNNTIKTTLNGKEIETEGTGEVVEFTPIVYKNASGNDGEYIYYDISTQVSAILKDQGNFYVTDLQAFWSGLNIYVQNKPENLVITAVTESGRTVEFTPYVEGGPTENTYILQAPSVTDYGVTEHYQFNIFFNTSQPSAASSKWILDEDAVLMISYKIPFDSKTVDGWGGELKNDQTLEDLLLAGNKVTNEVYFTYSSTINAMSNSIYGYNPMITKESKVNPDGTIDYTVVFNNTVPGSYGNEGYINAGVAQAFFTDTFDERLEYVQDSLVVTCYDPWRDYLWLNKYKYSGTIEGNEINVPTYDFKFLEFNYAEAESIWGDWLAGSKDFESYYKHSVSGGGKHVYTYKLKVKDEYLYTVDNSKYYFDNTAEVLWDTSGTSGPVTENTEFETGLIDKNVVQQNDVLHFDVHINEKALDILEGTDTITIEDTMTQNLSVFWDTIELYYEDANGNWIDFNDASSVHSYTVTYDPDLNMLTFVVPDGLHIRIDYSTLITESGKVSIQNSVKVDGKAEVTDIIDAEFFVEKHSGDASGSLHGITLLKQDGTTTAPLEDATFVLYGPVGSGKTVPDGVDSFITFDDEIFYYIDQYVTGEDGTANITNQFLTVSSKYALVEQIPPDGYSLLTSPVFFYFYEGDPDGIIQTVSTILTVQNFIGGYVLPETGGMGVYYFYLAAGFMLTASSACLMIKRKRKRA